MITIALCNQKGGVGKSTTTFHLARAAVLARLRVLVIDADPQGNLTTALSREHLPEEIPGLADVLSSRTTETIATTVVPTIWDGATLVPTTGETLSVVRDELVVAGAGREGRLHQALRAVENDYDLVLIDCPPSLDQLTINSLTAADRIVIVSQSKLWSANGLAHLLSTIDAVQTHYNPRLAVKAIVINQHDEKTRSGAQWLSEIQEASAGRGINVLHPPIPKRVVIADSVEASVALDEYPGAPGELSEIYSDYLEEVMS